MGKPRDDDYSDDDFDDEYFSQTYRPLSNLPTPPPSSRESTAAQSPRSLLEDGGLLDSELLGEPPLPCASIPEPHPNPSSQQAQPSI